MFKYIRRMNSSENAPECININVTNDLPFYKGEICTVNEVGYLSTNLTPGLPKYLVLESKDMGDGKPQLKCMKIFEGMLFEATIQDIPYDPVMVGKRYALGVNETGHNLYVSSEYDNCVEIISTLHYERDSKIIVTFI